MKTQNVSEMPQKKVFLIGYWADYDVQFLDIGKVGSIAVEVINLKESKYHGNILARWFKRARHHQLKKLILKNWSWN